MPNTASRRTTRPASFRLGTEVFASPLVYQGTNEIAARQPLVPGLLVSVGPAPNRNRARTTVVFDSQIPPEDHDLWTDHVQHGRSPVDTDCYLLSATTIRILGGWKIRWHAAAHSFYQAYGQRRYFRLLKPLFPGADVWVAQARDANYRADRISSTSYRGFEPLRLTADTLEVAGTSQFVGLINGLVAPNEENHHCLIRASDIEQIVNMSELPSDYRAKIREQLRVGGYSCAGRSLTKLDALCAGGRSDRLSGVTRIYDRKYYQNNFRSRAESVRSNLRDAVDNFESCAPNDAAYCLRQAIGYATRGSQDRPDRKPQSRDVLTKELLRSFNKQTGADWVLTDCGHFASADETEHVRAHAYDESITAALCPDCVSNNVVAITMDDGSEVDFWGDRVRAFYWSDGTYRLTDEPKLIGNYHSSKSIVGFVKPTVPALVTPTMGFELEVQRHPDAREGSVEFYARKVRSVIDAELGTALGQKYLSMEYDGSVTDGFEMVSGWTYLDMHRHVLKKLLAEQNWERKLRSHSASCSCGLHVHMEMPKSMIHAARLRYMLNSREFETIIKAVARRYNTNYAKVVGNSMSVSKTIATKLRDYKPWNSRGTSYVKDPAVIDSAKKCLSNDRYELLNFTGGKTVEFRIFKGSMVYGTVMACLEFSLACWRFTRDTPASQITVDAFIEFINRPEHSRDTRCLRPLLHRKGFSSVRIAKPTPGTAQAEESLAA